MKRQLIITDVTRIQEGRVCIAGYDQNGCCVRPVLPEAGIHESELYSKGQPIIFPFAVVMFDLQQQIVEPPHTEDWRYDPTSVSYVRKLDEKHKRETLEKPLFRDPAAIFQVPILSGPGHYVMAGQGPRSLGTIQPKQILEASYTYRQIDSRWDYRLHFVDRCVKLKGVAFWSTN